jgi:hypothetical protein
MNAASMRKYAPLACFLAAIVLFYFASRPAYRGYFSEDDLATLSWAPIAGADSYYGEILNPKSNDLNFRPFAALYYSFLGRTAKLRYVPYVVVLQLLHVLNVVLLIFLLREFGFSWIAAGAGVLFYAFNAATMEAYWKPMFVFDLLCGTLCLAALLLYVRGRWLLALIPFWLAFKSKEIAVMLPVALLAYELLLGQRKWKRLLPFFFVSLSFGLQALWHNNSIPAQNTYALRFTPEAALTAIRFYSYSILGLQDLWVGILLLPFLIRDRRLWVGIALTVAMFVPLLFLSNRMLNVYWYVPLIGLAIAAAAMASRIPRWVVAAFFAVWLPFYFFMLRDKRRDILDEGNTTRTLVASLQEYKSKIPPVRAVVFDNLPRHLTPWGVSGAISVVFGHAVEPAYIRDPDAKEAFAKVPMALISFNPPPRGIDGLIRTHDGPQPYIRFSGKVVETQLKDGCYDAGYPVRWFAPRAEAALYRPPEATQFEIVAFLPPGSLAKEGPAEVTVFEDGQSLGTVKLSAAKSEPMRWKLSPGSPGDKSIMVVSKPVRHGGPEDNRDLGIAVQSLGYLPAP